MSRSRLPTRLPHDPLAELLHQLHLEGTLYCQAELTAPWGIAISDLEGCLGVLVVTEGRCLLELDGLEPRWLERGSVALVPDGRVHRVRSHPRARLVPLQELGVEPISSCFERLSHGGGGETTRVTYGVLRFDRCAARRLLGALPPVVHVDGLLEEGGWLAALVRLIRDEARELQIGGAAMVTRLADILVIAVLRAWLRTAPQAETGWLAGLRDPRLGRALFAMHRRPADPWDLAALGKEAGMSRSAFSSRFTAVVGEPAMQYLARWRLQLAHRDLQQTADGLGEIARRIGYGTEAAFCKAFKREFGVTPTSVRGVRV